MGYVNYREYLTENILPFWQKAVDHEYGGIMTQVDENGEVFCEDKNVWFLGRTMWSYTMAYNTVEKRPEYLDVCEEMFRFFEKCERPSGKLPFTVKRDGTLISEREQYCYSEAFAVMGLAQYYKACGREEVWEKANHYFDIIMRMYKASANSNQNIHTSVPAKTFGLHMAMLATAQFIRNVGRDTEKYDELARMAVEEMMTGGYVDDERKVVIEYVTPDKKYLDGDEGNEFCPGHIYEAAWFVLCEGEVKNDDKIRLFGKKLCDYAMQKGFEEKCKLIPTVADIEKYPFGNPQATCIWWPQCEAFIAYRLAHNIFGDEMYAKHAERIEKTAFEVFSDADGAEWYCESDSKGNIVDNNKGSILKGPFHIPRVLLALISLEETGNILKYMK